MEINRNVAVLGASDKPERTSHLAIHRLALSGYRVFPVHPSLREIQGHRVYQNLSEIDIPIHTLTIYLSEKNSTPLISEIIKLSPKRIILNPGAENLELEQVAISKGIEIEKACNLVLLSTGQF